MLLRALVFALVATGAAMAADLPKAWVDAATGHRIVRLSEEPGSTSLYFNFNAYTRDGKTVVIATPTGIAAVNLASHALTKIVSGKVRLLFVGRKSGLVYYASGEASSAAAKTIYAVSPQGGRAHVIATIAAGTIQSINADETLLAGVEEFGAAEIGRDGLMHQAEGAPLAKGAMMKARLEANIPMRIFTVEIKTGVVRTVTQSHDWLNHLNFSPTDPNLLLYCHEGEWHRVDRLWLIRTDLPDAKPLKLHSRSMAMEIAGHEWFSHDGKWIWYDLQTPRGEDFWVAGYEIASGKRLWYHLARNEWSVHYHSSPATAEAPDSALFSGDGGDNTMVAHAPDGKWLYLFRPVLTAEKDVSDHAAAPDALIHTGHFEAEKLVDMKDHQYHLEPNANFTPDGKWLIFRSNMLGAAQVYAVEVAKTP
ncbi:MAG: oligogalacturonate lyase family protein [Rhizomicrobium sp.]|nr:oligogalacturonate lyase family protein [Rhizomicrobium sp.]